MSTSLSAFETRARSPNFGHSILSMATGSRTRTDLSSPRPPLIVFRDFHHRESFPEVSYLKECHVVGESDFSQEAPMLGPPGSEGVERVKTSAMAAESLQNGREGGVADQSISVSSFVFLTLALCAVFVIWKKSKKDRRLVN